MIPIWKDTYYTTTGETLDYYIEEASGDTVFNGRAYKYPDSSTLSVNISRTVESFLDEDIPSVVFDNASGTTSIDGLIKTFNVYNADGTLLDTYEFVNDWSYQMWTGDTRDCPVDGKFINGMYVFSVPFSVATLSYRVASSAVSGYTVETCGDYALYYINSRGGVDSFALEGKCIRKEDVAFKEYTRFVSTDVRNRATDRYVGVISPKWELHTGWLTDAQSEVLAANLLTSNRVYLHDLKNDEIYPVNITDESIEWKEFRNSRKLNQYTINVKASNKRTRR